MFIYAIPKPEQVDPLVATKAHAKAQEELRLLSAGPASRAQGLLELSFWYSARAMLRVSRGPYAKTAAQVDWAAWRSAYEYYALWVRSDRTRIGATHVLGASQALMGTLSLCLMKRDDEAKLYLRRWGRGIEKTIDYMNIAKKIPRINVGDLAAIGFLYDRIFGWVPPHAALSYDESLLTAQGRTSILAARKVYARTTASTGCLLGGFMFERIPLELIYVNGFSAPNEQELGLNALADAIAATEYPDDPQLKSYDRTLTEIGF